MDATEDIVVIYKSTEKISDSSQTSASQKTSASQIRQGDRFSTPETQDKSDKSASENGSSSDTFAGFIEEPYEYPGYRVATTVYSSSNGGYTSSAETRWNAYTDWGGAPSYLKSKPDLYDAALDSLGNPLNPLHEWRRVYTYEDVSRWLQEYPLADLDVGELLEIHIENNEPSGYIDKALVTLVGSERTLEVRNSEGRPYGYRFYYALVRGCRMTPGCKALLSTKVVFSDDPFTSYYSAA